MPMHMQGFELGRFRLKAGVQEAQLIAASRAMESRHLAHQDGFGSHYVVALGDGRYLDVVLATSQEAAERICASWLGQPDCEAFLALIEAESIEFGRIL